MELTPTEFKVLFALASAPGNVLSRDKLVEKALGYQFEGYERSIDAHIKNIRQKIEDDPKNPQFILTVYGVASGGGRSRPQRTAYISVYNNKRVSRGVKTTRLKYNTGGFKWQT